MPQGAWLGAPAPAWSGHFRFCEITTAVTTEHNVLLLVPIWSFRTLCLWSRCLGNRQDTKIKYFMGMWMANSKQCWPVSCILNFSKSWHVDSRYLVRATPVKIIQDVFVQSLECAWIPLSPPHPKKNLQTSTWLLFHTRLCFLIAESYCVAFRVGCWGFQIYWHWQ